MPSTRLALLSFPALCTLLAAQDWRPMWPAHDPGPRSGVRLAYDAARNELLLFGGQPNNQPLSNETYIGNGTDWTLRTPTTAPSARKNAYLCYDTVRQRAVLHGGQVGVANVNDTWEWDGSNWNQVPTAAAPSARSFAAMTFDGARTLLYGGLATAGYLADVWSYNGTNWSQVATSGGPVGRYGHAMAADGQGTTLLYGGRNLNGMLDETWLLNGSSWTQVTTNPRPSARTLPALLRDPVQGRFVLFGGNDMFLQPRRDTWAFANGAWSQLTTVRAPGSIGNAGAAWHAGNQIGVLFGGDPLQITDPLAAIAGWQFGTDLASFQPWGTGCPSFNTPLLTATAQPVVGGSLATNLFTYGNVAGFVSLGLSNTTWSGGSLPIDLSTLGLGAGCLWYIRPDHTLYLGTGANLPLLTAIPNNPVLVGVTAHAQGFTFGSTSGSGNGFSASNAATIVVGRY